jgi:hypothetical protein
MTPEEQNRMFRIAQVVESYASRGIAITCTETDNWAAFPGTQIWAMQRRKSLPPHFTYEITILETGEVVTRN